MRTQTIPLTVLAERVAGLIDVTAMDARTVARRWACAVVAEWLLLTRLPVSREVVDELEAWCVDRVRAAARPARVATASVRAVA